MATRVTIPPPDIRAVVEKTAEFVARCGPEFEAKIIAQQGKEKKFQFLSENSPFHSFYRKRILDYRAGTANPNQIFIPKALEDSSFVALPHPLLALESEKQEISDLPVPEFALDLPGLSLRDVEKQKLAALFFSRHGNLIGNFPQSRLVDIYRSLFFPADSLRQKLEICAQSPFAVLDFLKPHLRRSPSTLPSSNKAAEISDLIDWHDFVVVASFDDDATPISALNHHDSLPITLPVPAGPARAAGPAEAVPAGPIDLVKCPLTGQLIPSAEFGEHMRVLLLDPKWRVERTTAQTRRQPREAVDVAGYLDEFVKHRSAAEAASVKKPRLE